MPVYNGEAYLREAMDSLLRQTFSDFEIVVVNDGSKDSSATILASYYDPRIKVIHNEGNKGLIASLNIGLKHIRGHYTARLDQDDIALKDRLQIQYDFMESHPEIDVVGSYTECIDKSGRVIKISRNPIDPIAIKYEFIFNNVMFHSSIFFRTEKVRGFGGYSEEFIHAEDYEMYSRPDKELICTNIPSVLFQYRVHGDSITGNATSHTLVHKNALNVAYRNMSKYIRIERNNFDRTKDILIIKKPAPHISFSTLIYSLSILKKVTKAFIQQNKLSKEEICSVMTSYRGRRKMVWQHYLIGKYHRLISKHA